MTDKELYKLAIECLADAIATQVHSRDDLRLLVTMLGLQQKSADEIEPIVTMVIAKNLAKVAQYRSGKTGLFDYFVGQVMKETNGLADPATIKQKLSAHFDAVR